MILLRVVWCGLVLASCAGFIPLHAQTHADAHLGGGGDIAVSFARVIVSLVFCVIIAALAILLLRQRNGKMDLRKLLVRIESGNRVIHIVEIRRLSPHADVCLLRHDDREFLFVIQQGSIHLLRDREVAAATRREQGN